MNNKLSLEAIDKLNDAEVRAEFFMRNAHFSAYVVNSDNLQLQKPPPSSQEQQAAINSAYKILCKRWRETGSPPTKTIRFLMRLICKLTQKGYDELTAFGIVLEEVKIHSEKSSETASGPDVFGALQTFIDQFKATTSQPKRAQLTQKEAAETISRARKAGGLSGVTIRTLQNWESGSTTAPDWYPGRYVTLGELTARVQQGVLQDRVKKAVRNGIKNKRGYSEMKDRPVDDE